MGHRHFTINIGLLDILKIWKKAQTGAHNHVHLEELLLQRGLINRLFGGRLPKLLNHSWQMYPLGFIFGLGFDTASEVGLLAMTAGGSAGDLPIAAVLSLPILFAAGMSVMDTTDGVLMSKAYNWALLNPLRKIFYNITATGLSVVVALGINTYLSCCRYSSAWVVCAVSSSTLLQRSISGFWATLS